MFLSWVLPCVVMNYSHEKLPVIGSELSFMEAVWGRGRG